GNAKMGLSRFAQSVDKKRGKHRAIQGVRHLLPGLVLRFVLAADPDCNMAQSRGERGTVSLTDLRQSLQLDDLLHRLVRLLLVEMSERSPHQQPDSHFSRVRMHGVDGLSLLQILECGGKSLSSGVALHQKQNGLQIRRTSLVPARRDIVNAEAL